MTLFSLVSAVLFTPLPVESPEEIVFIQSRNDSLTRVRAPISLPDFVDLRREQTSFEDLAAMSGTVYTLTGLSEPISAFGGQRNATSTRHGAYPAAPAARTMAMRCSHDSLSPPSPLAS